MYSTFPKPRDYIDYTDGRAACEDHSLQMRSAVLAGTRSHVGHQSAHVTQIGVLPFKVSYVGAVKERRGGTHKGHDNMAFSARRKRSREGHGMGAKQAQEVA